MKKQIIDILRRLAFIPLIIIFMAVLVIVNVVSCIFGNIFYWIITGESMPYDYLDEYKEKWLNYVASVLPNDEGNKIV